MKKLLLTCLLAIGIMSTAIGAEFNYGTYIGESGIYSLYLLDEENNTVAVNIDGAGENIVTPETLGNYKVVQLNSVIAKNITISSSIRNIAPGCFDKYLNYDGLESITFTKGDEPLNLCPSFSKMVYTNLVKIDINRDIICIDRSTDLGNSSLDMIPVGSSEAFVLKIGADVKTLKGPLFPLIKEHMMAP